MEKEIWNKGYSLARSFHSRAHTYKYDAVKWASERINVTRTQSANLLAGGGYAKLIASTEKVNKQFGVERRRKKELHHKTQANLEGRKKKPVAVIIY